MKVSHKETKRYENPTERFYEAMGKRRGERRLIQRLLDGRVVKPCGRECREYGLMIAKTTRHSSFQNFTELMNDEEFILEIARITPNPVECDNYFYQYINQYLRRKPEFRLKFLKQVYLNENVYKLEDIALIVEWCGFEKENLIILNDKEFKQQIQQRIASIDYRDEVYYHCSGEDKKEVHDYKVAANTLKVLSENKRKGLEEILTTFVSDNEDESEKQEPKDFFEYMKQLTRQ